MHIPNIARGAVSLLALFSPWDKSQWVASDDTVRGGISHSYLDVIPPKTPDNPFSQSIAKFYGTLDYATLDGSGFASQRTRDVDDWSGLDLSAYDRLLLEIPYTDGKIYTINVRDTVAAPSKDGKAQPTLNWAYDFQLPATKKGELSLTQVIIRFKDLVPTIRGTIQNDTEPLDLTHIVGASIMIRSFETTQDGDFELRIKSVAALGQDCEPPKVVFSCEDLCG
ncbi:hypothetical protein F66182_3311 [Fusarium sp. NRRL 66182]|nr:hypothetical protein F66182_3311 [Fusarium sp. NRRL 66182]